MSAAMNHHQESVYLRGHIIDSLVLAKVLDLILMMGGTFDLEDVHIGKTREEASHARIRIGTVSRTLLDDILKAIQPHGASIEREANCRIDRAPTDGVLPDDFYATTHLPTQIRLNGRWLDIDRIEMDLAILVDEQGSAAQAIPMGEVRRGNRIVVGREGVRIIPLQRPQERDVFGFMESQVSAERPHGHIIADIATRMRQLRERHRQKQADSQVLLAGGPAIIHAGGREALTWLIEQGFIHILFCGNALAAHDMEADLFGTSLGYGLTAGRAVPHGHEHHLLTINRIRSVGSIEAAVTSGMIRQGIMAACIRQGVPVVMSGTIRDDGPLPGVITDSVLAQRAMRALIPGVGLALLVASTLHSVATGNLLPATVPTVCVDVNPSVPTKLADRGSFQAVGLVMDAASFLSELARVLGRTT
jgi:lysine-ketoglutarate reductase/saccharopine dehydrogenase-like protein (TIGR00300 family)